MNLKLAANNKTEFMKIVTCWAKGVPSRLPTKTGLLSRESQSEINVSHIEVAHITISDKQI